MYVGISLIEGNGMAPAYIYIYISLLRYCTRIVSIDKLLKTCFYYFASNAGEVEPMYYKEVSVHLSTYFLYKTNYYAPRP